MLGFAIAILGGVGVGMGTASVAWGLVAFLSVLLIMFVWLMFRLGSTLRQLVSGLRLLGPGLRLLGPGLRWLEEHKESKTIESIILKDGKKEVTFVDGGVLTIKPDGNFTSIIRSSILDAVIIALHNYKN
jgi:hypothetical protein